MLSCSYLTEKEATEVGAWLGVSDKCDQSDDQVGDLQNYQPGDRVKSRIQLWEGKVEGPTRPNGKAGRQVNQVQPFSLQDDSQRVEGHKHRFKHIQHQNHENHEHLHKIENHAHLNHGLGHHYHENHVNQDHRIHNMPDHQNHNPEKYSHDMGEIQDQDTKNQKHQVHNHKNNANQVSGSKTRPNYADHEQSYQPSHQNVREKNIHVQADEIRTNGKVPKDKEQRFQEPRENLGETTSSNVFSKPKQNQSNRENVFQDPKVPSETTENVQNKSEGKNQKAQETQIPKNEGWNSKLSGILGGQGGLGWVQGKHCNQNI